MSNKFWNMFLCMLFPFYLKNIKRFTSAFRATTEEAADVSLQSRSGSQLLSFVL